MSMKWVSAARRAMLASICMSALAVSGQALAQDVSPLRPSKCRPKKPAPPADAPDTGRRPRRASDRTSSSPRAAATSSCRTSRSRLRPIRASSSIARARSTSPDVADTTPNVNLETSRGTNTTLTAFIRGVGQQDPVAGFEQGVGIYLDDVYLNRPQGALLDIYDVERIEVLRGPQGTLYGRNTIGGAVKYVTRRLADVPAGSVRANVGTYKQLDLVMSRFDAARRGVQGGRRCRAPQSRRLRQEPHDRRGKLQQGHLGGSRNDRVRAVRQCLLPPVRRLHLGQQQSARRPSADPGLLSGALRCSTTCSTAAAGSMDPTQKVKGGGVALHGEIGVNDWLKLQIDHRLPQGHERHADRLRCAAAGRCRRSGDLREQAVQPGSAGGHRARPARRHHRRLLPRRGCPQRSSTCVLYTHGALLGIPGFTASAPTAKSAPRPGPVFGDFTYDITEQFSLSAGGRYTNDKRHAAMLRQNRTSSAARPSFGGATPFGGGISSAPPRPTSTAKRKDTAFTPRASIAFKPNADHNIYASYSRGFKGGGFDPRGQTTQAPVQTPEGIFDYHGVRSGNRRQLRTRLERIGPRPAARAGRSPLSTPTTRTSRSRRRSAARRHRRSPTLLRQ